MRTNLTSVDYAGRGKVVIGHPYIGRGGSESTLMWLIEGLKRDFDVTVVTTSGWDLPALNAFYGTHVGVNEVTLRIAPVPFLIRSRNAAALRGSCYQRYARQIAGEYDIRLSAYNMTDWGLPAIHFIADFSWNREIRDRLHPPSLGLIYRKSLLRWAYLKISAAYEKPSGRDLLRDDLLIANSRWTETLVQEHCGIKCAAVVYPPVCSDFPAVPWKQKEQAFVMIGRIAPEKQIEKAIAILGSVRRRGYLVRLHLCGQIENDLYGKRIEQLCQENSGWIVLEGRVSGTKKADILSRCRFGIHACAADAFGISVAEMVKAGAIVFAPNNGGQTEILDSPALLFETVDDAADKICAVLASSEKQSALCAHLREKAALFSAEIFVDSSIAVVKSSLNRQFRMGEAITGFSRLTQKP